MKNMQYEISYLMDEIQVRDIISNYSLAINIASICTDELSIITHNRYHVLYLTLSTSPQGMNI